MTSHFTGGGPQSSWGPPPIFLTANDRKIGEFIRWIHPTHTYTYQEIPSIEPLDSILSARRSSHRHWWIQ